MYDDSCNGVWLLRESVHSRIAWHGANYETSVNDYENSEIHEWLNGEFLNSFDEKTRAAIKTVKIPYHKGTGSSGEVQSGADGLSCKIFLLGSYEVGFTTDDSEYIPVDGSRLEYFLNGEEDSDAIQRRVCEDSKERAVWWWLRSAYANSTDYAWYVYTDGTMHNYYTFVTGAVRPAFVLPSNLLVNEDGTINESVSDIQADNSAKKPRDDKVAGAALTVIETLLNGWAENPLICAEYKDAAVKKIEGAYKSFERGAITMVEALEMSLHPLD